MQVNVQARKLEQNQQIIKHWYLERQKEKCELQQKKQEGMYIQKFWGYQQESFFLNQLY